MFGKILKCIVGVMLCACLAHSTHAALKEPAVTKVWKGHTYSSYAGNVTWSEAYNFCKNNGGHLVTIASAEENQIVNGLMTAGDYYYIGGTDAGNEGQWRWLTGESWTYSNWNRGEPNNGNGGKPQNHQAMYINGTWDDAWTPDSNVDGFICEWDTEKPDIPSCNTGISSNSNDLYRKINEYLDTLKSEMKDKGNSDKDDGKKNDTLTSLAKSLKELDSKSNHKVLNFPADMLADEDAVLAAYKAYAEIFMEIYDKKVEIGEIDIDDDLTKTAADIVNDVAKMLNSQSGSSKIDGYDISYSYTGVISSGMGSIIVRKGGKQYLPIAVVSTGKDVLKTYAAFVEELRDVTYDAMKQTTMSVLSDLADVTGFAEWEKGEIKDVLKDAAQVLDDNGYGDVYRTAEKCREIYELIEDIIKLPTSKGFDASVKDTEKLIEKLENLDFSDNAVTNKAIKSALNDITKYKKELIESLYDYIYKVENNECPKEEKGFWGSVKDFFSIDIQCPVDFEVFDKYGYSIGYVKDGVVYGDDSIYVEKNGDTKTLLLPSDKEYSIKMTATDDGAMNYVVKKYTDSSQEARLNFYNVELTKGCELVQTVSGDRFSEDGDMLPIVTEDEEIYANEYLKYGEPEAYVIVVPTYTKGGKILNNNGEVYIKGDQVELTAFPTEEGYTFDGWYVDDEKVSSDMTYRFTALEDVSVECRFVYDGTVTSFDSPVSEWAKDEVEEAYECGLIPENLIGENLTRSITRSEFAAISVKLYETWSQTAFKTDDANVPFDDIEEDDNRDEIIKAYLLGITAGVSESSFAPDSLITREQLATMLCRTYKKKEWSDWTLANDDLYTLNYSGVMKFADDGDISDYAKPSVYFMVKYGVINGIGNNMFAPKNTTSAQEAIGYATATREQAVLMALRSYRNLK